MEEKTVSSIVILGIILIVLSGLVAALAGFGSRWGWWNFRVGFQMLRWAAYGGLAASGVCIISSAISFHNRTYGGMLLSVIGLLIGLVIAGIPWSWLQTARRVPAIHDITTDTANPPRFVSILPLRKDAPNSAEYGGKEITAQQIAAYPDVKPLHMNISPAASFEQALDTARKMGWEIVDFNRNEGRIEAVDTTFWFGFHDDIVVRITPEDAGSRADLRSVSRVGKSDIGTNAKRIRTFLKLIQG